MSRRAQRLDPWVDTAADMRSDAAARRVYGPLWPNLADIWALAPHTDLAGIATLVSLCAPPGADVDDFLGRLHRPRSGGAESPRAFMASWVPACRDRSIDLVADPGLLGWVGGARDRRLWAVVALVWGVAAADVPDTFGELEGLGARPVPLDVDAVSELATAEAHRIPALLVRDRPLDQVCATYAAACGVPPTAGIDVTLPAALAATASGLAADPNVGVAACALLIRAHRIPEVTPTSLRSCARPGTAAAGLADLLSQLWADSVREEPASADQRSR